jgi:hypothetical protein
MSRTTRVTLPLLVLLAASPPRARGEGCYIGIQPPLRQEVRHARIVVLAERAPPRQDGKGPLDEYRILEVLKGRPALGQTRTLSIPLGRNRFSSGSRSILFCEFSKQRGVFAYRGIPASPAALEYVKGLIRCADEPVKALLHCVRYLEHEDEQLAADAYTELSAAGDKALRAAAREVPAERLVRWLRDPKLAILRDAYGLLLAYHGDARHAALLRDLAQNPYNRANFPTAGFLTGYALLRPREGWAFVQRVLRDRNEPYYGRASALRAVRFFWDERTDLLPRADLLRAAVPLLAEREWMNAVASDLRRWQRWEMTDLVLARWERIPPDARDNTCHYPLVLFALDSPRPQAAAFVRSVRRTAPHVVEAAEATRRLERELKTP